jgi:glycosyltransferase involved in cell wall biosynthesis
MRVALLGDFDTFLFRGVERPRERSYYRLSPALNLARGFRELGLTDLHYLVVTPEVKTVTVDAGPFGVLHRIPRPAGSGSATFFLWRRHLLHRELAQIRPDIVHGQGTEQEYGFSAVTAPYRHVLTIHGIMQRVHQVVPPPVISLNHVPRWIEKYVVRHARDVICLSHEAEDFLREQHSPARCHRIANAVAPCYFEVEPRAHPGLNILFVGTPYRLKGLHHLVETLPQLPAAARVRIVGDITGAEVAQVYRQELEARLRQLGLQDRVEWLGIRREAEIAGLLAETEVLVLPSYQETAPMAVAEAMAAGVAVVATRAGGIPDLVEDGVTGQLVPVGDTAALAGALNAVLGDAALRRRYGAAGRATARTRFAPRVVAEATRRVYEAVLAA